MLLLAEPRAIRRPAERPSSFEVADKTNHRPICFDRRRAGCEEGAAFGPADPGAAWLLPESFRAVCRCVTDEWLRPRIRRISVAGAWARPRHVGGRGQFGRDIVQAWCVA